MMMQNGQTLPRGGMYWVVQCTSSPTIWIQYQDWIFETKFSDGMNVGVKFRAEETGCDTLDNQSHQPLKHLLKILEHVVQHLQPGICNKLRRSWIFDCQEQLAAALANKKILTSLLPQIFLCSRLPVFMTACAPLISSHYINQSNFAAERELYEKWRVRIIIGALLNGNVRSRRPCRKLIAV